MPTSAPLQTPTPTGPTTPDPVRTRRASVLVPVVVGLVLGPVDLLSQHLLPSPFASVANSSAVWAVVAFGVGWSALGRGRWWPGVAGTLALLLAVEGYYATAVLALGADPATLTNSTAQTWLTFAVAAGVVFGTAGAWARSSRRWLGSLGAATATSVLLAQAWLDLAQMVGAGDGVASRHDIVQTALGLLVLAAVAAVLSGRSARQRVGGAVLALPLALVGALAFTTLGLG